MTVFTAPRDDLIRMLELPAAQLEFRAAGDDDSGTLGTLTGYAAVFNSPTVIDSWEGKFLETIAPGAFRDTLKKNGERVKVLFNHGFDPSIGDKPLGKPAVMREDRTGLYVEVPLDDTSYNRDLVASLRSEALDGQSFRFSVNREEWKEPADTKSLPERTIKAVTLFEFGPVRPISPGALPTSPPPSPMLAPRITPMASPILAPRRSRPCPSRRWRRPSNERRSSPDDQHGPHLCRG